MNKDQFVYVPTAEYEFFHIGLRGNIIRIYLEGLEDGMYWVNLDFVDQSSQTFPFVTRGHAIEFIEDVTKLYLNEFTPVLVEPQA